MKRFAIIAASLVLVVAVMFLVLYSNLGTLITNAVTTAGPEILQAQVELKKTVIDAGSGKGSLQGLVIGNPQGFETESLFKMDEVKVALDVDSITSDTIVIKEISVQAPEVTYELGGSGSNIDALQKNVDTFVKKYADSSKTREKSAPQKDGVKLVIDHVYIKGGQVNVSASFLGGKSMTVPLPEIHLKDLGKEEKGTSPGEVVKEIIAALKKGILAAVAPLNLDKMGDAAGKVVTGAKDVVVGTAEGVGDTLKKGTEGVGDTVKGIFGK